MRSDPGDAVLGARLGDRYRIDALLARGGMAHVYRARDERLDRDVAIKVLAPPYTDDPDFTRRFLAEARAAGSLSHPSLVHVYDSGSDGAAHFIVMELLDRHRSLREELDARGPLPRDEVLRIGSELLAGLRVVHDHGLVHCDVKSGNVMLGPGPAKLIDFGIARSPREVADSATSIGSLHFMSPEQLRGDTLTPASDLFSLGAVLYEALTGQVPYPGADPDEVGAAHRAGTVRPPSALVPGVPGRLDDAILQALRREPGQRFHSAAAMARALSAAADEAERAHGDDTTRVVPVPAPQASDSYVPPPAPGAAPTSPGRRPGPGPARRRGSPWSLIWTLVILGAVGLVVLLVIVPLLDLGGQGIVPASQAPTPVPSVPAGSTIVPEAIGLSAADAFAVSNEAGLNATLFCNEDPSQPEGVIHQEPPAGTIVLRGSRFSMYSARIADCPGS